MQQTRRNSLRDEEGGYVMERRGSTHNFMGDDEPIEECDKRFKIVEKLGEGTYGNVFKAIDLTNN